MQALPIVEAPSADSRPTADHPQQSKGSYCFVSLGCPKNLVDSERMLGTLALDGYTLVSEPDG
ncbi:MAG: 30S ribosomal protein S12 methylthiotransferase RimO, partial [Planctomycetaceae bacterium]|nr:30S ribosomal protein S12 methylthiotransferase RimO [Planctomycetaceae bacterium]